MRNIIEVEGNRDFHALPTGEVLRCRTSGELHQRYYLYLPDDFHKTTPLLVSVHGISRNARGHALRFADFAEHYGVALLVPRFNRRLFPDFQRLGREQRGLRADHALHAMLHEVSDLTGLDTQRIYMFGYSGGGQFTHRYAMAYPEQVVAIAIGAAGWYTLPDLQFKYPYGIAPNRRLPELRFNAEHFLRIPACAFVGEQDCKRDNALRQSSQIDALQGQTRLERARCWIASMREAALTYGYDTHYQMEVLPNSDHSFSRSVRFGGLGERVFRFLFETCEMSYAQEC